MTLRAFWQGPAVHLPAQNPAEPFGWGYRHGTLRFQTAHDRLGLLEEDSGFLRTPDGYSRGSLLHRGEVGFEERYVVSIVIFGRHIICFMWFGS